MKDIRHKQAKWYGVFLLIFAPLMFIYSYIEVSSEMKNYGTEIFIWDIMKGTLPNTIFAVVIGAGLLKIAPIIKSEKTWPSIVWLLIILIELSGSIYIISQTLHIAFILKSVVLSFFLLTAIKQTKKTQTN